MIYSMGYLDRRRSAAGDGVPLQPAPPQRRHLARPLRGRDHRQPSPPHAGLPYARADAPGQPLLPFPRAGHARAPTHGPKLTHAPLSDPHTTDTQRPTYLFFDRITRLRRQGEPYFADGLPELPGRPPPRDSRGLRRRLGYSSPTRWWRPTTESSPERIAKPPVPANGSLGTRRPRSARRSGRTEELRPPPPRRRRRCPGSTARHQRAGPLLCTL